MNVFNLGSFLNEFHNAVQYYKHLRWSIFQFNPDCFQNCECFSFRKSFEWVSQCCATLNNLEWSRIQFKLVYLFLLQLLVITFKNDDRLTDIPKLNLEMNTEWLTLEIVHQCWKDRAGSREPFGSKKCTIFRSLIEGSVFQSRWGCT